MFTAIDPADGRIIDLFARMARTKRDPAEGRRLRAINATIPTWTCRFCRAHVTAVLGAQLAWHFRHQPAAESCHRNSDGREGPDHRRLKIAVANMLQREGAVPLERISFEEELKIGEHGRVADVYAVVKDRAVAFEIQLSPIDADELKRRTIDYDEAGIEVRWVFLNGDSWTHPLRRWLLREGFIVLSARFESDSVAQLVGRYETNGVT